MTLRNRTLSAEEFNNLLGKNDALWKMFRRATIEDYKGFIKMLYEDIDDIFDQMARSKCYMQEDSEDRITSELVSNLRMLSYNATHDTMSGGHVDLLVEIKKFCWIGEAKFSKGPVELREGFLQLTTRYSNGNPSNDCGGLLIYIINKNARETMSNWKNSLYESKVAEDLTISDCDSNVLAFFSTHTHETTGLPYKVRHIPLLLYFNPQDSSGLKRAVTNTSDI